MTPKFTSVISGALALFGLMATATAQTAIWQYSTGQNTAVGQVDNSVIVYHNYTNSVVWNGGSWGIGTSAVYAINPPSNSWYDSQPLVWVSAPGDSKWTSVSTDGKTQHTGTYTFSYDFSNSSGFTEALFSTSYAVDDKVTDILLNGTSIYGDRGPTGSWTEISVLTQIPISLYLGDNTLQVVVRNNNPEWVSLAAQYSITSAAIAPVENNPPTTQIPEPSVSLFSIIGLTCFVICGRNRRRH